MTNFAQKLCGMDLVFTSLYTNSVKHDEYKTYNGKNKSKIFSVMIVPDITIFSVPKANFKKFYKVLNWCLPPKFQHQIMCWLIISRPSKSFVTFIKRKGFCWWWVSPWLKERRYKKDVLSGYIQTIEWKENSISLKYLEHNW